MEQSIPKDLKEKIITFKDMFPQYKQSTNDDILAIFEEYNNDYEAAVYGTVNGLSTNKPSAGWQAVGQKKKKKMRGQSRSQFTNQKNSRTNSKNDSTDRGRRGNSRGHSNAGSSSRGRATAASTSTKISAPPSWGEQNNSISTPSPPQNSQPSRSTNPEPPIVSPTPPVTQAPPSQKVSVQNSTPSSVPQTGGRLTYANVARSREAWNPNARPPKKDTVQPKEAKPQPPAEPQVQMQPPLQQQQPQERVIERPAEHIPERPILSTNVQQTQQTANSSTAAPSAPSQTFSQQSPPTVQKSQETHSSSQNVLSSGSLTPKAEKPRVGVLLPGNFASEDSSMTFQFGNLGLQANDLVAGHPSEPQEIPSTQSGSMPSNPAVRHSKPQDTQSSTPKPDQEPDHSAMPMGPPYTHQYPMYAMESADPALARGPPMFYPDYQHGYSRDGKYRGNNTQNASGRGEGNAKFSSPDTANTAQPSQPFHYGYPMYPAPYQFPGGSYGNQFYGYGYNPKFPGYSGNYGNTMAYEDEYKHRMPGQYYPGQEGAAPNREGKPAGPPAAGAERNPSGSNASASQPSSQGNSGKQQGSGSQGKGNANPGSGSGTGAPPGMEGNFPSQSDFKSPDFYGNEYNSFVSAPFFHPNQYQQQPGNRY